jgi:peptide-methionine (R)-S-oxide reductase
MIKKIKLSQNSWMTIFIISIIVGAFCWIMWISSKPVSDQEMFGVTNSADFKPEITKTEDEWKKLLTPQQYAVLRLKGTDAPFSETVLLNEKRPGTYVTADCEEPVFRSEQKYDSKTGWPSFWAPIEGSVVELPDNSLGISRTEVVGKKCGGHLGHVFSDGPLPSGLRYCINPAALKFIPD